MTESEVREAMLRDKVKRMRQSSLEKMEKDKRRGG